MLTSHSRCHGTPPKGAVGVSRTAFMDDFRRADEMKYRLMPYVYAQAKDSSERGLPMVRALFVEFPDDPGSWHVEDEYLFGSRDPGGAAVRIGQHRPRCLSAAGRVDRLSDAAKVHAGGWHRIEAGEIPVVMLVRDGALIPQ